jgi:5-bromo-4-chloroindolyl phosphate hydrolysis protein
MQNIIKEKGSGGKMIYRYKEGHEIETYEDDIFEALDRLLHILDCYFQLEIESNQEDDTPRIGRIVLEKAKLTLNEIWKAVEEDIGEINVDRAHDNNCSIRKDQVLHAFIKPNNQDK